MLFFNSLTPCPDFFCPVPEKLGKTRCSRCFNWPAFSTSGGTTSRKFSQAKENTVSYSEREGRGRPLRASPCREHIYMKRCVSESRSRSLDLSTPPFAKLTNTRHCPPCQSPLQKKKRKRKFIDDDVRTLFHPRKKKRENLEFSTSFFSFLFRSSFPLLSFLRPIGKFRLRPLT